MIYLLWTLINFAAIIVFIAIAFRAIKLVRETIGTLAAIFLAFGLFAFATTKEVQSESLVPKSNDALQFIPVQSYQSSSVNSEYRNTTLADYVGTELNMKVLFSKDTNGVKQKVDKLSFSFEGFVGGHKWEPTSTRIYPSNNRETFRYEVEGHLKWTLLGMTLYSQTKHFSGGIDLK